MLKERRRTLKAQVQANYDEAAPMQDVLAQLAVNNTALSPVQPPPIPAKYAFEERERIAHFFFNASSAAVCDRNLDRQISIIDHLVSLGTRYELRPRKARKSWEDNIVISSSDNSIHLDINPKFSDSNTPVECEFPPNIDLSNVYIA
ncbi:hypothetical protein MMC21_008392 [Puttea exsequens]|nr:hypothetical protein [Puttea exsequens]